MIEKDKEFWDKDMTRVHDKRTWFSAMSSTRKIVYGLLLLFVIVWCFFLGFTAVSATLPQGDELHLITAKEYEEEIQINEVVELSGMQVILLIGCDNRTSGDVARSDTLMLAFLNNDTGEISLLSIPRDAYVNIAGTSTNTKINHAFSSGGVKLTKATVEQLTGIAIDNYAIVDFNGFKEVVDAIGGVTINVDTRMYKPSEGIDLYEGEQVLDGADALAFCRYRGYSNGDFGRIEHQQQFLTALADQLLSASTISSVPELVKIAYEYVETDISLSDAINIAKFMLSMDYENIKTYSFEGVCMFLKEYSMWLSYVILSESEVVGILNEIVDGDFDFDPYVIDDGGNGRYSVPSDEEAPVEDGLEELPDVADPDSLIPGLLDPGIEDPGLLEEELEEGVTEEGDTENTDDGGSGENAPPVDPGVSDPGIWDIPEPQE